MREQTKDSITFTYPDSTAFAFNPVLLVVKGTGLKSLRVIVKAAGKSYDTTYDAFSGVCYADVRTYVQAMFDGQAFSVDYTGQKSAQTGKTIRIIMQANKTDDTNTAVVSDIYFVWGALAYGEVWGAYRKQWMWSGFPFVFSVYSDGSADGRLIIANDGKATSVLNLGSERGLYNIPIPKLTARRYYDIIDFNGTIAQGAFANQFDLTFFSVANGTQKRIMRIYVGDSDYTAGIYLRWIDRHGFWQHYMFRVGDRKAAVTADGEFLRNNLLSYDMTYGYQGGTGRRQSYGREDTYDICAPLVDTDTLDVLQDLTTSPVVDMYLGGGWVAVTVKAGTYTKSNEELQDFSCSVVMNETPVQSL